MKRARRFAFVLTGLLFFAGCGQPLRTLMAIDAEQKAQQRYQRRQEVLFYRLVEDVKAGRLKEGVSRQEVLRRYGDPITMDETSIVYRKPCAYFKATKVAVSFDEDDRIKTLRIEEASP